MSETSGENTDQDVETDGGPDLLGLCPECNSIHRPSERCKPWR
jgi:hypothetical protein